MSTEPRMVDVTVIETRTVPIPEPEWCVDPHDGAQSFTDLTHNGPRTTATIETRTGTARFLEAYISHAPYLAIRPEPHPLVAVVLDLHADLEAEAIPGLTRNLREAADLLDQIGAEALRLRNGGQG
ncbi:DUF6907 domain-containing protein [Streptomyces sp. NPDC058614]|uniref:DUF6907 domain-containing protein n=1 Tax=Streptomyces sp. NPDC058614 TaxID=3346557 RepID=UPI00366A0CD5